MEATSREEIHHHFVRYMQVFGSLAVLTVLTVLASTLKGSTAFHVVLALIIAMVKATLVTLFFMHVVSEKRSKFAVWSATFCVIFFFAVLLIPLFTIGEMHGSKNISAAPGTIQAMADEGRLPTHDGHGDEHGEESHEGH